MNVAPFPTYCLCILHLHSLESLCCDAVCVCMGPLIWGSPRSILSSSVQSNVVPQWRERCSRVWSERKSDVKQKGPRQFPSRGNARQRLPHCALLYRLPGLGNNPRNFLLVGLTLFWGSHFILLIYLKLYNMVFHYLMRLYTCQAHKAILFWALELQIVFNTGICQVWVRFPNCSHLLRSCFLFLDLVLSYITSHVIDTFVIKVFPCFLCVALSDRPWRYITSMEKGQSPDVLRNTRTERSCRKRILSLQTCLYSRLLRIGGKSTSRLPPASAYILLLSQQYW